MNRLSKIAIILGIAFSVISNLALAQATNQTVPEDGEFNIFLMTIATVFIAGMIGAAIVGAMIAALILFLLFALISFGVFSASMAVAIYRRSISSGFKSLLFIVFGTGCSAISLFGVLIVKHLFHLQISWPVISVVGVCSGLFGGLAMALATYKLIQWTISSVAVKLRLI